ncbi:MAG: hypothetical protein JWM56_16 [Candidatus Peribacteria bacterium]|nr:hypothetical protein [Candidatus Peribacteria bacterium]
MKLHTETIVAKTLGNSTDALKAYKNQIIKNVIVDMQQNTSVPIFRLCAPEVVKHLQNRKATSLLMQHWSYGTEYADVFPPEPVLVAERKLFKIILEEHGRYVQILPDTLHAMMKKLYVSVQKEIGVSCEDRNILPVTIGFAFIEQSIIDTLYREKLLSTAADRNIDANRARIVQDIIRQIPDCTSELGRRLQMPEQPLLAI